MLAARSSGGPVSGGGHPPHHLTALNATKGGTSPSGTQVTASRRTATRRRDREDRWSLRMFGERTEDTVAQQTGMMYR